MANITAADVNKLRKQTGAGMMDCKKALTEADGDFDKAIEIIREKGQAVAKKRSDREASEGVVFAKTTQDESKGFIISMNCETDFVAKNDDFIKLATQIIDVAVEKQPNNLDELKQLQISGKSVEENINYYTGITGEKLELAYYYHTAASKVTAYIHMDNKLAALVGLNKENTDQEVAKNVAMQVAAMDPVAVDKDSVPQDVVDKEYEIGKKQAQSEGKPENILDKIAKGKVEKFMKENTLLNQEFIRDSKKTVRQYLQEQDKELTVLEFKYYSLKQ